MSNNPLLRPAESRLASPLRGEISVPGDKSLSHRALILASQCPGTTHISGLLEGEDVLNTAQALRSLGVTVTALGGQRWRVEGVGVGKLKEPSSMLEMGNSGTSARLLMGLLTPYPFHSFFAGDASLSRRPMKRVITPLSEMGATFEARAEDKLPLLLKGTANPQAIHYRLPVASAQVKSAILLAALNTPGTTTVVEPIPTRDHTENMLRSLGLPIEVTRRGSETHITLTGKTELPVQERRFSVPGDPSSAAFMAVAACITPGSHITLRHVGINPLRTGLFATLKEMGAELHYLHVREEGGEQVADITVKYSKLRGIVVPAERAPSMIDEYPILSIAAACAEGDTVMHGLAELRVKESDRLQAVFNGLTACGVQARIDGDTLIVSGNGAPPRGGATITTHFDHRIAMSFLVLGAVSPQPVAVDDVTPIATSFPNFMGLMNGLGAKITVQEQHTRPRGLVIAIDGPAASGKGTLARRLAEHFGYNYLDTGSLYRAVGLKLVYSNQDPEDENAAVAAAESIDAEDLANPRLRQERIGVAASQVAAMPRVRKALLAFQRNFAATGGVVLDGRDIGTVVCPDADLKFFITASLQTRAERRHRELQGEGIEVVFQSVLDDLAERDARDSARKAAPLQAAADAIIVDSTEMDANRVFATVRAAVEEKLAQNGTPAPQADNAL